MSHAPDKASDSVATKSEGGCTNCGEKGGCDTRKGGMFAAIDAAMARLYPTRCFGERVEPDDLDDVAEQAASNASAARLARRLGEKLGTLVLELPPNPEEYCRHIYVLCLGRSPSLIEALHGLAALAPDDVTSEQLEELYLRVSVSDLVPFAAVQQVRMRATVLADGNSLLVEEAPRAGVFDPVLLARFQRVVAIMVEEGFRNIDFGEINEAPAGFDPGDYAQRYGSEPVLANYLFYPQPCASITTTVVPFLVV